jgi:lipopolysaccharide/colanic/teichoic acid biosynthesis glycosyltransferase
LAYSGYCINYKIESNESVFFKQKRSGLNNEPFDCIKFRSMTANENADLETTTKNDARVTKFGHSCEKQYRRAASVY